MKEVYYKLIKRSAWHCQKCLSSAGDNLHSPIGEKGRYLLELFSGSKTVSSVAGREFKFKTFAIDVEEKFKPDLCIDIRKLSLKGIPESKKVSIIWASVPCQFFTILNIKANWEKITYSHRKYYYVPKTTQAKTAIQLLEKTLWIIRKINPDYYFIENPRGALRHMPQINFAPFMYSISYNDFESDLYKPTDLFTNCSFLKFPKIKTAVGRQFRSSVLELKDSYTRSIVPAGLVRSILSQIENQNR